jgi:hypothetical protein
MSRRHRGMGRLRAWLTRVLGWDRYPHEAD